MLTIDNFSYTYPGTEKPVLKDVTLKAGPGECHCITGPTGSGKSTLLMAVKDLLPKGRTNGRISISSALAEKQAGIGIVLQNPDIQVLGATIGAEMAFGLENLSVRPRDMEGIMARRLEDVGLFKPLDHPVATLSTGEKYRLVLAGVLAMAPTLLLLDEPAAQLDDNGILRIQSILAGLKAAGTTIVLCEHQPQRFSGLIDQYWAMAPQKRLIPENARPPAPITLPPDPAPGCELPDRPGQAVVEAQQLSPRLKGCTPVWTDATFAVDQGNRVAVYGPNGAGKSTLLRCITGFVVPEQGAVRVFGMPPAPARLRGKIGYLFQNPQRQLFENTVLDEVAFPLKRMGLPKARIREKAVHMLAQTGLSALADRSPHKLSFGQKHLVVVASILISTPKLLILDDPYAGLDVEWKKKVTVLLQNMIKKFETTLIWCGHQADDAFPSPDKVLFINRGKIEITC